MEAITKAELKRRSGVRSDTTLGNWEAAGLIRKPVIKSSPNGRGTTGYYPVEMVDLCLEIKRLTKQGRNLQEVKVILEYERERPRPQKQTKRGRAKRSKTADLGARQIWIADRVAKESKKLARHVRDTRTPELITDALIQEAARLASEGHPPLLVIGVEKSFVMADYVAADFFAQHPEPEAVVMMPLRELFSEELEQAERVWKPSGKADVADVTVNKKGDRRMTKPKSVETQPTDGKFNRSIEVD